MFVHKLPYRSLLLATTVALAACSGGTGNIPQNPPGTLPPCNPGTQAQLSQPISGAQGVGTATGFVQVVVNAGSDVLNGGWNLILLDAQGNTISGGILSPASGYGGTHPYATNFWYNATIPTLGSGTIYKAYINKTSSSCQPAFVGSFATGT